MLKAVFVTVLGDVSKEISSFLFIAVRCTAAIVINDEVKSLLRDFRVSCGFIYA